MEKQTVKIFVSYSHKDASYLQDDSLLGFLKGLESDDVELWTDLEIQAGDRWDDEIRGKIAEVHIALVLVSQAFLDSSYCTDVEISGFIEKRREQGLVIFPVILSPCEWERHDWLASTQFLPAGGETIEEHYSEEGKKKRLFLEIRKQLRARIDQVREAWVEGADAAGISTIRMERRQVTILYCQLTLAGAGPEPLDPEEEIEAFAEMRPQFHEICQQAAQRFAGHVAPASIAGVLYFGYPIAHEDDALRAVRTGLEIRGRAAALCPECEEKYAAQPQIRVGIDTGPSIVDASGKQEHPPGLTANRMFETATALVKGVRPGAVMVSAATRRLLAGFVASELAGSDPPLGERFRVLRVSEAANRLEATRARKRTPLVGRDQELELLQERWELAREGRGQLILLSGEVGIGKSRLMEALIERIAKKGSRHQIYRCSAYHTTSAFHPILHYLNRGLRLEKEDPPAAKLAKIERALGELDLPLDEFAPLLGSLLSVPLGDRYPPLDQDPKHQREKTMEALLTWVAELSLREPLLLVAEDLHWIDPSSLDFLTLLVENLATLRLLAVFTFRPEFVPPWPARTYINRINLSPLPQKQVRMIVERLTGGKPLPEEVLERLVRKTDGIPLFVEELTKMLLESGLLEQREDRYELSGTITSLDIPTTLNESLMARLDRLGLAKNVAQLGATLGREFIYELLRAVSSWGEENLRPQLKRLVDAELLFRRGFGRRTAYIFKHALIRDIAYHTLLKKKRQEYHKRIAEALEEGFPETVETQPELVAKHYTEAGDYPQAIAYWQRAGQRAVERSANVEAIDHLRKGLELCEKLPDTLELRRKKLGLQTALGVPLTLTKGHATAEVEEAYAQAEALCREVGEPQQLLQVLAGSWRFHLMRGELEEATERANELETLGERLPGPTSRLVTCRALSTTLFYLGQFPEALKIADQGVAIYEAEKTVTDKLVFVYAPAVSCLSYGALVQWNQGLVETARQRSERSVAVARETQHAHTLVMALFIDCLLLLLERRSESAMTRAEELGPLSSEQAFSFMLTGAIFMRGRALYDQGGRDEGLREMERGLAGWRDAGARLVSPLWHFWLAESYGREARFEEALELVEQALVSTRASHERWWRPELHRLKGQLLLAGERATDRAESCLRRAHQLAGELGARPQQLRAALELARLWQRAGKTEAARDLLQQSRAGFREGLETPDLKAARAFEIELGGGG